MDEHARPGPIPSPQSPSPCGDGCARHRLAGDAHARGRAARSRHLRGVVRGRQPGADPRRPSLHLSRRAHRAGRRRLPRRGMALASRPRALRPRAVAGDPARTGPQRSAEILDRARKAGLRAPSRRRQDIVLPERSRDQFDDLLPRAGACAGAARVAAPCRSSGNPPLDPDRCKPRDAGSPLAERRGRGMVLRVVVGSRDSALQPSGCSGRISRRRASRYKASEKGGVDQ